MTNYSSNEFKNGLKVIIDQDPCVIIDNYFNKPGKGQAFTHIKFRNLISGRVLERNYKSGESLPGADVDELDMQYLYTDDDFYHFMMQDTFEQYSITENVMQETKKWLKPEDICKVTLWNDVPISVTPPQMVALEITETDPGLKGDTASGGTKPAVLETGATVKVPLFVQEGETIKVNTETGEYISRVKVDG